MKFHSFSVTQYRNAKVKRTRKVQNAINHVNQRPVSTRKRWNIQSSHLLT